MLADPPAHLLKGPSLEARLRSPPVIFAQVVDALDLPRQHAAAQGGVCGSGMRVVSQPLQPLSQGVYC